MAATTARANEGVLPVDEDGECHWIRGISVMASLGRYNLHDPLVI
jgi:hypothetical protein